MSGIGAWYRQFNNEYEYFNEVSAPIPILVSVHPYYILIDATKNKWVQDSGVEVSMTFPNLENEKNKFHVFQVPWEPCMSCSNRGDSRGEAATSCASSQIVQSLTHWVERMPFAFSWFVITKIFVDTFIICRLYP